MDAGLTPAPAGQDETTTETTSAIGQLSYTGQARSYDDVAAWLESQSQQAIYEEAYFTTATKEPDTASGQEVVTFASTMQITDQAYSGRYGATGSSPTAPDGTTPTTPDGTSATPAPSGSGGEPQ